MSLLFRLRQAVTVSNSLKISFISIHVHDVINLKKMNRQVKNSSEIIVAKIRKLEKMI